MSAPIRQSTVTCPRCRHREAVEMAEDACRYFYRCPGCGTTVRPLPGDCSVFCSYGTTPCPSIQRRAAGIAAVR